MRSRSAALGLVLLGATASAARAQLPERVSGGAVHVSEYVEVTTSRLREKADEVPASIEVITGEELSAWGATDLRSALALAAGLDVAPGGDGGPAASVPEFWGRKAFDAFLLLGDGVPWGGAFNPATATVDLQDVQRIEVLRGPAPVTYGATSFVGVIHVVHKDVGTRRTSVSASAGSHGSGAGQVVAPSFKWAGFS